ncbi:MAG: DUF445 family protein [Thermoguttaceae bacterium]|nr:DUF445 family protein [Thermoguttaceae bacterium]
MKKTMFSGTRKRFEMVVDVTRSREARLFALFEIACFYISCATFLALAAYFFLARYGNVEFSPTCRAILTTATTAAVGYLTNWLAIEMLFKPYDRIDWFWIWPQGLAPRNKKEIGGKAGEKIATELLTPEKIWEKTLDAASRLLESDEAKQKISAEILRLLRQNEETLIKRAVPFIENAVAKIAREHIRTERVKEFFRNEIAPRLRSEKTAALIAQKIVAGLEKNSPEVIVTLKGWLREYVIRYAQNNFMGFGGELLADGLISFIDWRDVERVIDKKLQTSETQELIERIALTFVDDFKRWLDSPESTETTNAFVEAIRTRLIEFVRNYLQTMFPQHLNSLLVSPQVARWLNESFIPNARVFLEERGEEHFAKLLESIDVKGIISRSIEEQDIREFHRMIDDVAAEHLGAIQTLGFVLGGVIGLLTLLM